MSELGSSSSSPASPSRDLIAQWKTFVAQTTRLTSASLASSGSDSQQSQTTGLAIPEYGFYAISDAVDVVPALGADAGVMVLDCISVPWFWDTLHENEEKYEPLDFRKVKAEETSTRAELLQALLVGDIAPELPNRRLVLIFIPPGQIGAVKDRFPPGKWINVAIDCPDAPPGAEARTQLLETNPATADAPTFVVTHSLHDRFARAATAVDVLRPSLNDVETAFLTEVFSLNHVPDVDLGDGTTTPPPEPVPTPIVLDEGGFVFDGDPEFWSEAAPFDLGSIDETTIEPWEEEDVAGKAKHKTSGTVFTVVRGEDDAEEGEYTLTLETEQQAFELSLGEEGSIAVQAVGRFADAEVDQTEDGVEVRIGDTVLRHDGPVEDLFEPPPSSSSSSSMIASELPPTPWTPKKATRPRRRINLDSVARQLFTEDEEPQQEKPGTSLGKAKASGSSDLSEANKENLDPRQLRFFDPMKLPTLKNPKTKKDVTVSPSKRYLRQLR